MLGNAFPLSQESDVWSLLLYCMFYIFSSIGKLSGRPDHRVCATKNRYDDEIRMMSRLCLLSGNLKSDGIQKNYSVTSLSPLYFLIPYIGVRCPCERV